MADLREKLADLLLEMYDHQGSREGALRGAQSIFENLKDDLAKAGWQLNWPATSAWPREADRPSQERRLSELREWRRNLGPVQDYPLPIEDIDALLAIADERDSLRSQLDEVEGKAGVTTKRSRLLLNIDGSHDVEFTE